MLLKRGCVYVCPKCICSHIHWHWTFSAILELYVNVEQEKTNKEGRELFRVAQAMGEHEKIWHPAWHKHTLPCQLPMGNTLKIMTWNGCMYIVKNGKDHHHNKHMRQKTSSSHSYMLAACTIHCLGVFIWGLCQLMHSTILVCKTVAHYYVLLWFQRGQVKWKKYRKRL